MLPEAIVSVPSDVRFTHAPLGHRDQTPPEKRKQGKCLQGSTHRLMEEHKEEKRCVDVKELTMVAAGSKEMSVGELGDGSNEVRCVCVRVVW